MAGYVGATNFQAASANSSTVSYPSGIPDGSAALLGVVYNPATAIPNTPSGWTLENTYNFSTSMEVKIFSRAVGAAQSSTTFSLTLTNAVKHSGALIVLSAVTLPLNFKVGASTGTLANGTATTNVARVAFVFERGGTPSTAYTAPSGFTLGTQVHQTGGGSTGTGVAYKVTTSAPATYGGEAWGVNNAPGGVVSFNIAVPITSGGGGGLPSLLFTRSLRAVEYAAHRGGDPGPEETDYAYTKSYQGSNSGAEGDMQVNASGSVVFMHDDTIDRTASASSPTTTGNVSAMTDAQWAAHLVKPNSGLVAPDSHPSTLASLAALHGPSGSLGARLLVLENKVGTPAATTIAAIIAAGIADRTIYNGYTYTDVTLARQNGLAAMWQPQAADITAGLNFTQIKTDGIDFLGCDKANVNATFCTNAHAAGLKVWVYTVNSTSERDTYLGYGVDGFFTNKATVLDPRSGTGSEIWFGSGGAWVPCLVYKGVSGAWQQQTIWTGVSGAWK